MSERKDYSDNRDKRISIDDDYIELLSSVDSDEYEDVYSYSSYEQNDSLDVYSDSSKDIYVGRRNSQNRREQNNAVYISGDRSRAQQRVPNRVSKASTGEFQRTQTEAPTPPPVKRPKMQDSDEISDYEARRKKISPKKKKFPIGFVVIAVVLAIVIGIGGILFTSANSIIGKFEEADEIEHIDDVASLASDKNVKNILFIGADKEKGGASRSDSIMIVSVNKKTGKITLCSILRDTHVDIPGEREAKINAAHSWGGPTLLVKTIEQNFGIKIDDYASVDFNMFTELVDGLGGIDVEVTEAEANYINNVHNYKSEEKPEYVESGENVHLSGYQALWYSRIRYLDSDFMRTQRQRKVITAIIEKAKGKLNPAGVFELVSTAENVAPFVKTTLSTSDFWSLAMSLVSCFSKSGGNMDELIVSQKIPFDDTWWYETKWDGSSIVINLEKNREMLYDLLYGEPVEEETTEDLQ